MWLAYSLRLCLSTKDFTYVEHSCHAPDILIVWCLGTGMT